MPIPPDPEPLPIELAICCIAKNEARHLLEWIAYHRVVGVEHFLVFDNESDDGTTEILNILAAKGVIDHVPWIAREDGASPQLSAFAEGVRRLRDRAKWTACIDLDQFLLPVGTDDVRSILRDFDDAAGLVVPRRVFGSQGEMEGRDDLVLRRFTRLAPGGQTQMGRSIVRARHVKEMGVHTPVLAQGSMVRLSDTGRLVINDYFCRSQGGYVEASAGYDRNEAESPEILRFEGRLREMRAALLQIINDGTVPDSYYHQARE